MPLPTLSHKIIPRIISDSSACMVTPLLPLTYTQTNHSEHLAHLPFPSLSDVAVSPVAPSSGDTVGVFSLLSLMISVNPSDLM